MVTCSTCVAHKCNTVAIKNINAAHYECVASPNLLVFPVLFLHLYLLYITLLFSISDTTNTDVSTENVHRTVTSIDTRHKELLLLLEILRISLIEMESESGKESKENINMSVRVTKKKEICPSLLPACARLSSTRICLNDSQKY